MTDTASEYNCLECGVPEGVRHDLDCSIYRVSVDPALIDKLDYSVPAPVVKFIGDPEKKIEGSTLSEKAQAASDARQMARGDIRRLIDMLQAEVDLDSGLTVDEPEGAVVVQLYVSLTLARQLITSLKAAESLL